MLDKTIALVAFVVASLATGAGFVASALILHYQTVGAIYGLLFLLIALLTAGLALITFTWVIEEWSN
jgi:hypothetical protein